MESSRNGPKKDHINWWKVEEVYQGKERINDKNQEMDQKYGLNYYNLSKIKNVFVILSIHKPSPG